MAVLFPVTWTTSSTVEALLTGKTGAFADRFFKFLRINEGLTGSIDGMLYNYLGGLGYTGTIENRMDQWEAAGFATGASGDALLLETGDFLLLETGDKLLLE